jgi:hypothetical protein
MSVQPDGTIVYTLNPITTEAPGTYTAAVWAIGPDPLNQMFVLQDFQVGTATVEPYASGPADGSKCASCHRNQTPGGKMHMAHIPPGFSPVGNYALDSLPIGSCKACHNNAGYSPNHLLRKTHGVHRGEHQAAAGVAHPEYGFGADSSLTAFLNVGFPAMPDRRYARNRAARLGGDGEGLHGLPRERRVDDPAVARGVWHLSRQRLLAGALLADGGVDPSATEAVITPPTVLGFPAGTTGCTNDASCSGFSGIATCNATTKNCELTTHAKQTDDSQCTTCHGPTNGVSPIAGRHAIAPYNPPISLEGYAFKNVTVTGGSGPGGSFQVGDTLTLKFQLFDNQATPAPVTDLAATGGAWAGTFLVAVRPATPSASTASGRAD